MSRFEATLLAEFVQESLELLEELGTACGELSSSTEPNAQLATIDRGLHTIKGNAAALGFMQLSAASSKVLQAVRTEGNSGTPSASCLGRIWRFLIECRQYLMLVSNEKTPEEAFFTSADDEVSFASESPISAPAEAIVLEANELSVDDILAMVPDINPDIRRLIPGVEAPPRLEVELIQPEAAVEPAEAANASDDDPAANQAAQHAETVAACRRRAADAGFDAKALDEVEAFLRELSGSAADPERAIDDYLRGVIEDAEALGSALHLKISSELEESDLRVLPALGHLLRHLLTELVHLRFVHMSKADNEIHWKIQSSREEDRLEVRLIGLSTGKRTSALDRVRMQSSLEFLEDLEGAVRSEKDMLALSLSVAGLRSQNCCLIHSSDGRFCLTADCVRDPKDGSSELVVFGREGETRLKVDAIKPAQEMLIVESEENLVEEGILGFALSFAYGEKIPLLDPDSI